MWIFAEASRYLPLKRIPVLEVAFVWGWGSLKHLVELSDSFPANIYKEQSEFSNLTPQYFEDLHRGTF